MITLLHVMIALASVAYITALMFRPLQRSLELAMISVAATLASGVALIVVNPAAMLHVCTSGTVYLVAATAAIAFARHQKAKYFTVN